MICTGAMLGVLLAWPVVFGGSSSASATPVTRSGGTVRITVPPTEMSAPAIHTVPAAAARAAPVSIPAPGALETCSQRFRRTVPLCTSEGCRLATADDLDICEGTGFWPE